MDLIEDALNPRRMIEETLANFSVVATPGSGAILFSRRWEGTGLPQNLHASAVATTYGLSSLDYAKRRYTAAPLAAPVATPTDLFVKATLFARSQIESAKRRVTTEEVPITLGAFSARVALQRLDSGFRAADLLYRLGYNYEGDAVSRQILEQIAWSLTVGSLEEMEKIGRVKAQSCLGELKRLIPWTGPMYGLLSATTHAGLDEHLEVFVAGDDGPDSVITSWSRLSHSAQTLLLLADAWIVVWEKTLHDLMTSFSAFEHGSARLPVEDREFMVLARAHIQAIQALEQKTKGQ